MRHALNRCATTTANNYLNDVWVVEFSEVVDVRVLLLLDLLDGHQLVVQLADEDGALSSGPEPLEIRDVLERDLPVVWRKRFELK